MLDRYIAIAHRQSFSWLLVYEIFLVYYGQQIVIILKLQFLIARKATSDIIYVVSKGELMLLGYNILII